MGRTPLQGGLVSQVCGPEASKAALAIWQLDPPTRRQGRERGAGTPSGRESTSGIGGILWSLLVLYCSMMTMGNGQQGEAKQPLRDAGLVSPPGEQHR